MTAKEIRKKINEAKGEKSRIKKDIKVFKTKIKENKKKVSLNEKAKEIITLVGLKTQEQIKFHISDITSLALETVFDNPYKLELDFVQRRNKTECDIYFTRNENKIDPLSSSGGGAVDIASFALRIASWALQMPRTRNTIILDEPLRFLSKEYREEASIMLKEVSQKLGIQFIIVTHDSVLTRYADKIFEVSIKKGISNVNTLD